MKNKQSQIVDLKTLEHFLTRIDGASNVKRGFNFVGEKGTATAGKAQEQFWTFSELKNKLQELQDIGRAGFFFVNQSTTKGTKAKHITGLNAFVADIDFKSAKGYDKVTNPEPFTLEQLLEKLPIKPHLVVFTGNGYHLYFLAAPGTPIETRRDIQERIAFVLRDFGSDKASLHLLRMPGTFNRKENGWKPVKLVLDAWHPRYTLEEISAALPELPKANKIQTGKKNPVIFSSELTFEGYTQQEVYEHTLRYVETAAWGASDGNRHNTLNSLMPTICGRGLSYEQMILCVARFNELTGHDTNEAIRQLDDAIKANPGWVPNLPKRYKWSTKLQRRRPQPKMDFKGIDEARQELNEKLYLMIKGLKPGLTVIKATPGIGKTTATADALREMIETKAWPMVGNRRAKILFLTDNHKLAGEMAQKTQTPPAEVYQGRSKLNCVQHEIIDGQVNPGSYCKNMCPIYKKGLCSYYTNREKVMRRDFIIAPKQAFLNNSDELRRFDLVIIDESLSDYLQSRVTLDIDGLNKLVEAIKASSIDPQEHDTAFAFVRGLIREISPTKKSARRERVLRRNPPTVDVRGLERALTGPDGKLIKAPAFWSLLEHSHRIRVDYEKFLIHITCDNSPLADALATLPVINLDATPIPELLQRFKPKYLNFDVKQNYKLYQGARFLFSRAMWRRSKYQDMGIDLTRQIINACKGPVAVFGFKDKLAVLEAATGAPGVKYGAYGADSKGTNEYEGIENIILTGLFTPNVSAMNDIAAVAGIKAEKLITQKQDAEIAQTIGRARAVNALKPVNVFVLSNQALKSEIKPESISQFLAENKPQNTNERIDRYRCQDKKLSPVDVPKSTKDLPPRRSLAQVIKDALTPIEGIKRKLKQAVQHCIDTHGFYAHDLLGFGAGRLSQVRALQGVSTKQHERYIGAVLHEMGLERHSLQIDVGVHIAVWGSLDAAVDLITRPDELEAAKQHVQRVYRQSGGALALCQTANALGLTVQVLDLMREQNFKAHNWAVLVHKKHLRDREFIAVE